MSIEKLVERVALAILAEQNKEAFPNNLNLARAAIAAYEAAKPVAGTSGELTSEMRALIRLGPYEGVAATRIMHCMKEAASRIEALEALVAELTARAETAEADASQWQGTLRYCEGEWSDERGTMIDTIQRERARALTAEAALAKASGDALVSPDGEG